MADIFLKPSQNFLLGNRNNYVVVYTNSFLGQSRFRDLKSMVKTQ